VNTFRFLRGLVISAESECGRPGEPAADFNLCPAGDFMETVTAQQWIFYKFYFCKAGRTMTNGLVSVKRECRYDSDYYTYEWSSLNDDEKCVSRIQGTTEILLQ